MDFLFSYSGPISFRIKRQLLRNIKSNIEAITKNPLLQKRIRYVFDEMVSNVYEYYIQQGFSGEITSLDGYLKSDHLLEFTLTSTISENDKVLLKNQIDFINSLDETRLRELYKHKLNDGINSEEGKAGIGLLSIRMKSGHPIVCEFKKNKANEMVFLKTVLNLKNE